MKKTFLYATALALLASCAANEELSSNKEQPTQPQGTVNFDVYAQRTQSRAGQAGAIDNATLKAGAGFGVFAYYTSNEFFETGTATPNFMYNQQVTYADDDKGWIYEPVKYWPNEFGASAQSEDVERLSFFAYAPWVEVQPSTGLPVQGATNEAVAPEQNITQLTRNTATGDPIVKYVVCTVPDYSVDLLWGVAAKNYTGIVDENNQPTSSVTEGNSFIDMTKQGNADGKMKWAFKHALAQLNVQICAVVDDTTSTVGATEVGTEASGVKDDSTKIYVRSITIDGIATQGALNLHSAKVTSLADATPNWKAYDGVSRLLTKEVTFYDGLRDGFEGTSNNQMRNEYPTGLNQKLLEKYQPGNWGAKDAGVTKTLVNLFQGATEATAADAPIYVIPTGNPVSIEIAYDVETANKKMAKVLSDGQTHGVKIENCIRKAIAIDDDGTPLALVPGKSYTIKIYLGMESVKFDVAVTEWQDAVPQEVYVPGSSLLTIVAAAISGDPGTTESGNPYVYSGSFAITGEDASNNPIVTYTVNSGNIGTNGVNIMNDFARFLGSLWRNGQLPGSIEYNSEEYTWNESLGLKGSNYTSDGTTNGTLVKALVTAFNSGVRTGVLHTQEGDITINVVIN